MPRAEVVEAGFLVEAASLEDVGVVDAAEGSDLVVGRIPETVGAGAGVDRGLAEGRALVALDDHACGVGHVGDGTEGVAMVVVLEVLVGYVVSVDIVDVENLEHQRLVDPVAVRISAEKRLWHTWLILRLNLPAIIHVSQSPVNTSLGIPVFFAHAPAEWIKGGGLEQEVVPEPVHLDQFVAVIVGVDVVSVVDQVAVGVVGADHAAHRGISVDGVIRVRCRDSVCNHRDPVVHAVDVVRAVLDRDQRDRVRLEPRGSGPGGAVNPCYS